MIGSIVLAAIVGWGLWFLATCLRSRNRMKIGEACFGAVIGALVAVLAQQPLTSPGMHWLTAAGETSVARVTSVACSDTELPLVECSLILQGSTGTLSRDFALLCDRIRIIDDQGKQLVPLGSPRSGGIECVPDRVKISEVGVSIHLTFARDAESQKIALLEVALQDTYGYIHPIKVKNISILG